MSDQELVRTFVSIHVQALQASADLVDMSSFRMAAQLIANAERIDVYGVGGSSSIASGLVDRLYQIGVNARAWSDLQMGIMSAACLGNGDVAVGVSSSGSTMETVEMLSIARGAGAKTIAITGGMRSPITEQADVVIRTAPPNDYLDFRAMASSHTQMFAADLLYVLAAGHDRQRSMVLAEAQQAAIAQHNRTEASHRGGARSHHLGG